jgi:radical SAM protein with 4Fe4S-binding SPASM domain
MHEKKLPVRLFTNGALLHEKNRARISESNIQDLVISVQTHTEESYRAHRRGKPDFEEYMNNIRQTVEDKFRTPSEMQIELSYMNTKPFNEFRRGKGYQEPLFPLVDDNQKAFAIIEEWKSFGRQISAKYGLNHEPVDLGGLKGPYQNDPLACVRDNHCEILPGVILSFKELNTFSDYLVNPIKFVERYASDCKSIQEQFAVLANGNVTLCCVDFDGKMAIGNIRRQSIESLWSSKKVRELQKINRQGMFPLQLCRVCHAFQVKDDYKEKFAGEGDQPYELKHGWYPLENDGKDWFRWTGKRAALILRGNSKHVDFLARKGHPRLEKTEIVVRQGSRRKRYRLKGDTWMSIRFPLENIGAQGEEVILESETFWVPAQLFADSADRRELAIMVKEVRVR